MIEYSYDPPYNHWSGNRSDTLNKWKINYKGSIATASALPEKGDFKGDTYNVLEDGSDYMWNGTSWDKLDANTYVGATSEANGIRGLVPPATTSQMYSLLTGSGIWKSGTELGLAYDNAVVHIANREVITGVKIFKNTSEGFLSGETVTDLVIRNPVINQETPAGLTRSYTRVIFADAEGDTEETQAGRMGVLELQSPKENDTVGALLKLRCYNYRTDSETAMSAAASFTTGYDLDGIAFATAPATSSTRNNGTDIVTRSWISEDTRIVHTVNNETINGTKTFTQDIIIEKESYPYLIITNTSIDTEQNPFPAIGGYRGGIVLKDVNGKVFSAVRNYSDSNTNEFNFTNFLDNDYSNSLHLRTSVSDDVRTHAFYPAPNSSISLGVASYKWKEVFSDTSVINTSDARLKTSLESVPDEVLDAWGDINFLQFKMRDSVKVKGLENARIHNGLVAQQVEEIFKAHNLDISRYGLFCWDSWEARPEKRNEDDTIAEAALEAGDCYALRYEEALCMEAAYQRRRAERAEARIKALEDRLEALEARLA